MDRGRVIQVGTPHEVYQEPLTEFVADFLGVANLLDVECLPGSAGTRTVRYGDFTLEAQAPPGDDPTARRAVIRPECVEVQESGITGPNTLPGMVDGVVFLGSTTQVMVRLPHGAVVQSLVTNDARRVNLATGQPVTVHLPPQSLRVLASADQVPAALAADG
jgi:ABC-type Fe3+/spermidine/putrescine transport system ATPase subunit